MPKINLGLEIGDWVARALYKTGHSQTELAKELGSSQQVVSRRIRENRIDYDMLRAVFSLTEAKDPEITAVMKGRFY